MGSKLISVGCSFTDHRYYHMAYREKTPEDHKFWDELMAEDLGLELHNYGKSGTGSDRHLYDVGQAVAEHGKDIEASIVAWSIWDRFSFPYSVGIDHVCPPHFERHEGRPVDLYEESFKHCQKYRPYNLLKACLQNAFNSMFIVTKLADSIGAKLLISQLLKPVNTHMQATYSTNMLSKKDLTSQRQLRTIYEATEENPSFKALENDDRLQGFPFIKRLGGTHIWDKRSTTPESFFKKAYMINRPIEKPWAPVERKEGRDKWGNLDTHPNAKGQKFIYTKMKKYWNELYK